VLEKNLSESKSEHPKGTLTASGGGAKAEEAIAEGSLENAKTEPKIIGNDIPGNTKAYTGEEAYIEDFGAKESAPNLAGNKSNRSFCKSLGNNRIEINGQKHVQVSAGAFRRKRQRSPRSIFSTLRHLRTGRSRQPTTHVNCRRHLKPLKTRCRPKTQRELKTHFRIQREPLTRNLNSLLRFRLRHNPTQTKTFKTESRF
jgi:hypothetical protein